MKTIQMIIDARLLKAVDELTRVRKTSPADEAKLRRERIRELEAQHSSGYRQQARSLGRIRHVARRARLGRCLKRGNVCWYTIQTPNKCTPVLILTRDSAIRVLNSVTVAPPQLCAVNFDNLQTVRRSPTCQRRK